MWDFTNNVLSLIGTSTLVSLVATLIIKGSITNEFQKKLETHKQELNKDIESLKHKQSKLYKDFELFTIKKHEHYPELYKLIELCIGSVFSLRGYSRDLSFENANKDDIEGFINDKKLTSEDKKTILELWDSNKKLAIEKLNYRLNRIKYNEAEEECRKANNFHLLNALYFSEEVFQTTSELMSNIYNLWSNYDPDIPLLDDPDYLKHTSNQNKEYIEVIKDLKSKLKVQMKGELSSHD